VLANRLIMNLQATEDIRVFIDKGRYGSTPIEATDVGNIPNNRKENLSWKGCYYTIKKGENFTFDRSNDWDRCYFKLGNGAEFLIGCGNPKSFIDSNNINVC